MSEQQNRLEEQNFGQQGYDTAQQQQPPSDQQQMGYGLQIVVNSCRLMRHCI